MPISFAQFPANWRLPLFWLEVDPSMAGLPVTREPALLVGQMFTANQGPNSQAGTAIPNVPIPIGTLHQAQDAFGEGSMLDRMFQAFFENSYGQEVWALPIAEPTGNAAKGDIVVAAPPSDAGNLYLYIAGQRLQVSVAATDLKPDVANKIVTEINDIDNVTLPVTAAISGTDPNTVTLTCKWKGATGNDISIWANYYGSIGGETYPPGLALTFPAGNHLGVGPTGYPGTGTPDWTNGPQKDAIANIAELDFKYVSMPFTDQASILTWEYEYGFSDNGRWGWLRQLYGLIFSAYRGTYAQLLTWSYTQNSGVYTVLGVEPESPTPVWEWGAAYTSKAARSLLNDPARPLQTLTLDGVLSAPHHFRFPKNELQTFTTAGIATQTSSFETGQPPMILRESTTYQLNKYGISDDAYELITTMATLTRLFRNMRAAITSKYPRHKLADDGTRFGPGQAIVTPKMIKAELVAEYRIDEFNGLVENARAFKTNLIVERNNMDPNRLDVLYPPDLVNQLRVFAVLAQFRLQYNRGVDMVVGDLV